jgi:hypothetical protein
MLSGRRLGWSAIRYTLNLSSCCADGEAFELKRWAAPVPPSPGRAGGLPRPAGRTSVLSPDRQYDRQLSWSEPRTIRPHGPLESLLETSEI